MSLHSRWGTEAGGLLSAGRSPPAGEACTGIASTLSALDQDILEIAALCNILPWALRYSSESADHQDTPPKVQTTSQWTRAEMVFLIVEHSASVKLHYRLPIQTTAEQTGTNIEAKGLLSSFLGLHRSLEHLLGSFRSQRSDVSIAVTIT